MKKPSGDVIFKRQMVYFSELDRPNLSFSTIPLFEPSTVYLFLMLFLDKSVVRKQINDVKNFSPLFQLLFNLLTVVMFLSPFTYINVGIAPLTSPQDVLYNAIPFYILCLAADFFMI